MAKRGRKPNIKLDENNTIDYSESNSVENKKKCDNICITGENPAQSNIYISNDAQKEFSGQRNATVNAANNTRTKLSNFQELNPAYSPENVPLASTNWQPASVLTVTGKKPGYHYNWVLNTPEAIYRSIEEGHEVDQDETCCANMVRKTDPTGRWSNVKIRGDLILMRMPEEVKKSRDAYFKSRINNSSSVAKQIASEHNSSGGKGTISGEISTEKVVEKF